ncbi:MAG: nucleoside-diphosphate sugar epimerase/dehydratase [Candidatus Poribacteria bacterium]|nr:nucleoside-diphosphate sugar epimerase/dehydratase [Candidatus Poribacteria bacterium]
MEKSKIKWSSSIVIDILLVNFAFLLTYFTCKQLNFDILTRFNEIPILSEISSSQLLFCIAAVVVTLVRIITFLCFRIYKPIWQYAGVKEFRSLITAVGISSLVLICLLAFLKQFDTWTFFLIDGFFNASLIGFAKFSYRIFHEGKPKDVASPRTKVLIVGAGAAGIGVLRELRSHPEKGYLPIGFIDDSLLKVGKSIAGLEVLGTTRDLTYIARKREIEEVIIAMPSAPGGKIRDITRQCEYRRCQFKIVPNIHAILESKISINHIREVKLEDLLNRSTTTVDLAEISKYLSGKRVMVTGAGGSIGSELCRQVAKLNPELLILFGRGENSLYHIDMELRESDPQLNRELIIGDIRDNSKVFQITKRYRPHIIFHAAAHKHVKFMEIHPDEAVKNNILGTQNLIDAAIKHKVEAFILVSSDKSVNPTSVYGASKRVTEKLIQCKANRNGTKFIAVRFGNVIGSRASVLPNFKRQIAKGGPVTVTHREATRYFMTIPEAVQLLIQAGAMGNGGEILMLDMGDPIKILDLARDLIRLSGLELDKDIKIDFTGLEPGEKLYEELLTPQEGVTATKHQRIFVAKMVNIEEEQLFSQIEELSELAEALDTDGIIAKFQELVPTYEPNRAFITNRDRDNQSDIRSHLINSAQDTETTEPATDRSV